jgi:hypothetical protein
MTAVATIRSKPTRRSTARREPAASEALSLLRVEAREHPYRTACVAAVAGFLVGRGPARLAGRLVGIVARAAALGVLGALARGGRPVERRS